MGRTVRKWDQVHKQQQVRPWELNATVVSRNSREPTVCVKLMLFRNGVKSVLSNIYWKTFFPRIIFAISFIVSFRWEKEESSFGRLFLLVSVPGFAGGAESDAEVWGLVLRQLPAPKSAATGFDASEWGPDRKQRLFPVPQRFLWLWRWAGFHAAARTAAREDDFVPAADKLAGEQSSGLYHSEWEDIQKCPRNTDEVNGPECQSPFLNIFKISRKSL